GLLAVAADFHGQDVRVEGLDLELLAQLVVADRDRLRLALATVKDGGHLALATQAAARTFAMRRADFGFDDECLFHGISRKYGLNNKTPRPRPGAASRGL